MHIDLAYDRNMLSVCVPDKNISSVLTMQKSTIIEDPHNALIQSFLHPIGGESLATLAKGKKNICIVISDYTRPVPNKIILPALFFELNRAGIPDTNITILIATGMHPPSTGTLLEEMIGKDIIKRYRVVNHYAQRSEDLRDLGTTDRGTPILVNKHYVDADLKILTGLIEPHFMAGFSGGRKSICPGVCALETMKVMHGPKIMEDPNSSNGILENNPFHEEALEIAELVGADFIVNVVIDDKRQICGIFSGCLRDAHAAGVVFCRKHVVDTVAQPVDIVITSNAGYPLDSNYYQTVKGMVTALDILKPGGTVIMASGCANGMGSEDFVDILERIDDLEAFVEEIQNPGVFQADQWEVEELNKALRKAEIYLYTDGLDDHQKKITKVTCIDSVEAGIIKALQKHGQDARIAIIPKGPYVMGRVKQ